MQNSCITSSASNRTHDGFASRAIVVSTCSMFATPASTFFSASVGAGSRSCGFCHGCGKPLTKAAATFMYCTATETRGAYSDCASLGNKRRAPAPMHCTCSSRKGHTTSVKTAVKSGVELRIGARVRSMS